MKFEKLLRGINFKKVIEGFNDANLNKREVVLCVDFGFVFSLLYNLCIKSRFTLYLWTEQLYIRTTYRDVLDLSQNTFHKCWFNERFGNEISTGENEYFVNGYIFIGRIKLKRTRAFIWKIRISINVHVHEMNTKNFENKTYVRFI